MSEAHLIWFVGLLVAVAGQVMSGRLYSEYPYLRVPMFLLNIVLVWIIYHLAAVVANIWNAVWG
jgi:hypothetical protein